VVSAPAAAANRMAPVSTAQLEPRVSTFWRFTLHAPSRLLVGSASSADRTAHVPPASDVDQGRKTASDRFGKGARPSGCRRHLISLAQTGSFGKSAAALFLAQPALSRSIRATSY